MCLIKHLLRSAMQGFTSTSDHRAAEAAAAAAEAAAASKTRLFQV
jgi:hypothetical protein